MNKINTFIMMVAVALLGLTDAQAQNVKTGSRDAAALTKAVEMFQGCKTRVVSFDGTAQTRLIASTPGLLCGVEIVSATEGNATTALWRVSFFDRASLSDVTLATTSLTGSNGKIVADQYGGPINHGGVGISLGGAFTAATMANTRNNFFRHPVKFNNGIVIENGSNANHGSMTIYWLE
jgi:hypothetical protein